MNNIFRTRELHLAAYLVGKGIKYLGAERITSESFYFTFADPDKCVELEKEFVVIKGKLMKSFEDETGN